MPRFLADLTPLKVSPAFRRLWIGNALSAVGSQLTLVAVSLEVYKLTGSSFHVGLLGAFAVVPLVVAGLYGGAVADHFDRRRVALASSAVLWGATAAIAAQAWAGVENVWVLYGLIAVHSGAGGINQPTRGAIIPALVGTRLLPAANALNMVTFGVAMMVGPLLGGVLVATVGYAWTYTVDVVTYLAALWAVFRLPPLPVAQPAADAGEAGTTAAAPRRRRVGLASVGEGFRFLATKPNVRMTFLIDLVAMITAAPRALLPAIGAVLIGGGETTVGVLLAATALGAFLTGLFSGPLTRINRHGAAVYASVVAWGLCVGGFGVVVFLASRDPLSDGGGAGDWLWPAAAFMALAGVADSVSGVFRNTILQSATPDHLRGRLQGVFIVVVAGGPRVGEMVAGGAAGLAGEAWVMIGGGALCVVLATVLVRWLPSFMRYDARNPTP
ncbi:MFS transporter [Zhihengliuella salsuginis]|uniref:MFS transporter n=1 Tax=Zhihengliuella salsuginis TaxID=578222 RepID=A0ABQ3GLL2_9MICC|nr:MFS transporter [Zhihengliuella salsuginis]GHD10150.1 MFS transporter [Zhihengliuella salsuginis]